MAIYKLKGDRENFWTFVIDGTQAAMEIGYDYDMSFDGQSKLGWWKALGGSFYQPDGYKLKSVNMPDIDIWSTMLVLYKKADKALEPEISSLGEYLPVTCEDIEYRLFHTMSVIDDSAIDFEKSEKTMVDGIFMGVEKLFFHEDKVPEDTLLFRTSFDNHTAVYCTEQFKNKVESSGLKGLFFETDLSKY